MTAAFGALCAREPAAILVMLAVLLARLALRRAPKRLTLLLWAVVCFRLLVPVSVQAPVSLIPEPVARTSAAMQTRPTSSALEALIEGPQASVHPENANAQSSRTPRQWRQLALELAALVWAAGACGILAVQLLRLVRLRRSLRGACLSEPGVFVCPALQSAFVLGLFRPRIYLPASLDAQQRAFVLLHEKTHIRRLDPLWKWLAFACLCLHWPNPLVWVCYRQFGRDLELACDEAATRVLDPAARCDYAQTLLALSGPKAAAPFPAFSQPEPEQRIRRVLNWKQPKTLICALALVLVLALGAGLLFNPASKDGIFAQRYQANALLYEAPQFDFSYTGGNYPAYALAEDHKLYEQQPGASFNERGWLQEISLPSKQLLALFDADWMAPDGGDLLQPVVRAQLSRVKSAWLCKTGAESHAPFYLVLQSGKQLLLAVGYGWDTDTALVRWLFSLTPDPTLFTTQELTALIRRSNNLTDRESIQIYSIYESESTPGLLFAAYDGDKNGVAVFSYDAAIPGYYIRMLTTSISQDTFYSETSTWYDLGKSFSIITSHSENLAEVRASWDGAELEAAVTTCPAMVILEWPDAFPLNPDSSPDIRFYNAAGRELPRD